MKRILALILTVVMLGATVSVAASTKDKAIFEVTSLGIIEGDKNNEVNIEEVITRGKFAKILLNLIGCKDMAGESHRQTFSDVPVSHEFSAYIELAYQLKLISGDEKGQFHPDNAILVQDAAVLIMKALGYQPIAEQKGGYPDGYISIAMSEGLFDSVSSHMNQPATYMDVIFMVYHALDIRIIQIDSFVNETYSFSDETLKSKLMEMDDTYQAKGVVTANASIWLLAPISNIRENQVQINGQIFDCGVVKAQDLIGQTVEIYYTEGDDGVKTLLNIAPAEKNTKTSITKKQLVSISNFEITYTEDNKNKKLKLSAQTGFVYNGRLMTDYLDSDKIILNGEYVCIDNDGDEIYDYVFIEEYECAVVDRVGRENGIFLKNNSLAANQKFISVDNDSDNDYIVMYADGKNMEVADIQEWDIISVYRSKDGTFVKIVVSQNTISGVLNMIGSDDTVGIEDNEYDVYNGCVWDNIRMGGNVTAYTNHTGEIVYIQDAQNSSSYGYIYAISKKNISSYEVKLIESNSVRFEVDYDEKDEEQETEIPVVVCRNKSIEIYELNDKLNFNGKKVASSSLYGGLISYAPVRFKTDKNGKISEIIQLSDGYGSTVTKLDFNAKDKTFGGIAGIAPFGINEKTQVICIPTNPNASNDDLMTQVNIDNKDKSIRYMASGYIQDETTNNVKLMVIVQDMNSDTILNLTKYSEIGIVLSAANYFDGHDELRKTTILTDGQVMTYITKEVSDHNGDVARLTKGDFSIFEINNDGYLVNAKIIKSLNRGIKSEISNNQLVNGSVTGVVQDIKLNQINNEQNKRVHLVDFTIDGVVTRVEIAARNAPKTYIYHTNNGKTEIVNAQDIVVGDILCIARPFGDVKNCVIIR